MNKQDTSQINQGTYYHKSLLNLCKVNILQKKVATAMVTTRYFLNYSISETKNKIHYSKSRLINSSNCALSFGITGISNSFNPPAFLSF